MVIKEEPLAQLLEEEILVEQEAYEAAYVVDHAVIAELPSGFVIDNPNNNEQYTVLEKLPGGGEGHTYLTQTGSAQKKVVKFVGVGLSTTSSELEQKLREEYRKINGVLNTKMTAFAANVLDVAVVNDYVEGRNLRQEIEEVDSVFTEAPTLDFLLQITKNYLQPLHENDLVHRDIKPQNIISTTQDEDRTYTLIDFGLLRKVSPNATITTTLSGTPGYTRIKADYECADDYYSLAKTAYFLFTGKDPEYVGHAKYDELHDQEIFGALKINENFRKVLFRMLGHDKKNKYQSYMDLMADLEKLQSTEGKNKALGAEEIGVDLKSAQILTEHREARQLPLSLQRNINGLKQRFNEQYEGTLASRVNLENDFVSDLEETLYALGYKKQGLVSIAQEQDPFKGMVTYLRQHRDSKNIDVLLVNPTTQGEHHLKYSNVESLGEAAKYFTPYKKDEDYYSVGIVTALLATTVTAVGMASYYAYRSDGSVGNAIATGAATLIGYGFFNLLTNAKLDSSNSFWLGLLGLPLPHSVGKLSYLTGNAIAKNNHEEKTTKNIDALDDALEPAAYFTYKRIEAV